MSASMSGMTALVTGGSRGIGRAVCLALAAEGADVAVNYAGNAAAAEETASACRDLGVRAETFQADVSDPASCTALAAAVKDRFGRIDILVNNAGITRDGLLMTAKEEDFTRVLDTNLKGTFFMMKAVSRIMVRQKFGRIVNMSSVVALHGNPGQSVYAASKAGVVGVTKAAARELAGKNITVNAVAPGFIETDMTAVLPEKVKQSILDSIPQGRAGRPEDAANAVRFLAARESGYITGQVLCVDGGMAV